MLIVKQEIYKSIINIGFVCSILVTVILCFTASAYTDYKTETAYSVFETVFLFERSFIELEQSLTALSIFKKALSGYITLFLPIVVAFPFMVSFCAERSSGEMRFIIVRTGKIKYYISKFISAFVGGGLSVFLGVAVFGIFIVLLFPVGEENNAIAFIIKQLMTSFLYGAVSTMPAFFLSSFCKNPYIITCIPFMLAYIRDTIVSKIIQDAIENRDQELIDLVLPYSTSSITSIAFALEMNEQVIRILAVNIILTIVLFVGFVLIMEMRKDKGA